MILTVTEQNTSMYPRVIEDLVEHVFVCILIHHDQYRHSTLGLSGDIALLLLENIYGYRNGERYSLQV